MSRKVPAKIKAVCNSLSKSRPAVASITPLRMGIAICRVFVAVVLLLAAPARAQCPAGWLPGAGIPGTDGDVWALAALPNGDVIVGGDFTTAGGVAGTRVIARFNPATGAWSPLGAGIPEEAGTVRALAVLPNGDVIVGGGFTVAGGVAANNIARYNPVTDEWSALGAGTDGAVRALAVLPDGDVIAGGEFSTAGGVAASCIARFNPVTGDWSGLASGANDWVLSITIQPNGDVIAGGVFSEAGNVAVRNIARFSPATGDWSALGAGIDGIVYALRILPGGDLIAGGDFNPSGGLRAVARHSQITGEWSHLGAGMPVDFNRVGALLVLPNGDVIAGGQSTAAGGVATNNIARYSQNSGAWSMLDGGTNNEVLSIAFLPQGEVLAGGRFTGAGSAHASRIARYNPITDVWSALGSGTNGGVTAFAVLPTGDIVAGGYFDIAGGVAASGIGRYNPTTGIWSALNSGVNNSVGAIAVLPGGDLIAGGRFDTAGGVSASRIARYNPTTDSWSALGAGIAGGPQPPVVNAIALLQGGEVIVGGRFDRAGGVTGRYCVARYNPTTDVWSGMGAGIPGLFQEVYAITVLPNGDAIIGGSFTGAGGVIAKRIVRYNPITGVWSPLGTGVDDYVYALASLPDGSVIAGGWFSEAGGVPASRIARYDPNTGVWSALGAGISGGVLPAVYALKVLPDGDVLVGGEFTAAGGVPANRIARCNPTTGVWSALGSGLNGAVGALEVLFGSDIVAGGGFTSAGGSISAYFARYSAVDSPAPTIAADPQPVAACSGGSASFTVAASGTAPFNYQWRKNSAAIRTADNPSAATPTLMLANIASGDIAHYDCVVTTPCGSATSSAAALSVCTADFNCDLHVGDADFDIFVVSYNILDCADPAMASGCPADLNNDGVVDDADFVIFAAGYNESLCP